MYYYVAVFQRDWELPDSLVLLAEINIESGLNFPSRPASRPAMFCSEKVAN